jgi:hypothetical protein
MILYLAFCISFGVRLTGWDESIPGQCYNTSAISRSQDSHPAADKVYLGITCFYFIGVFILVALASISWNEDRLGDSNSNPLERIFELAIFMIAKRDASYWALTYAAMQFPLHLWSMIALRVTNQQLLADHSEDMWGFGQIIAVIMLAGILIECFKGVKGQYYIQRSQN